MRSPHDLGLPFDGWRTGQRRAIRSILTTKLRHLVVQAPTGAGKSLIVAGAIQQLPDRARAGVLTATNALLQQYGSGFPCFTLIKGARNYECLAATSGEHRRYFRFVVQPHAVSCEDGPCRAGAPCTLRERGCLYYDAKNAAFAARAYLTNYAYHLAMRRYSDTGGLGPTDYLFLDEAHSLPDQLMGAYQIKIERHEAQGFRGTTLHAWKEWAERKREAVRKTDAEDEDLRVKRQQAVEKYDVLARIDPDTWAFDRGYDGGYVFEPTVPRLLFPLLTDSTTTAHLVYLSATVTASTLGLLNIPASDIETCALASTFPVDRRPVYLVPTTRVDYKMSGDQIAYWLHRIDSIIGQRLDRKGVIHCVSYQRQQFLKQQLKHRGLILAPDAASLTATVEAFKTMREPAVLLSPSIEQGFDFPYDACEYQILVKVPFLDTRSNITKARVAATDRYRDHMTMQRIVQMAGRGMRAADDHCETFIIDDHASWFLRHNADLAPAWFLESVRRTTRLPVPFSTLS